MKPYSYDGARYSNMSAIFKWAESSQRGPRRRPTRRASAAASARRVTNKRARNAAKRACAANEVP